MKNKLRSFIWALALLTPGFLMAQSDQAIKGKRGGDLLAASKEVYLEAVKKPNGMSFYPVNPAGDMLKTVPVSASITMVGTDALTTEVHDNVPLQDGCFTVGEAGFQYPVYMYAIKFQSNGEEVVVKYRLPGVTPRR